MIDGLIYIHTKVSRGRRWCKGKIKASCPCQGGISLRWQEQ